MQRKHLIQYSFIIKLGIEGIYLNTINTVYDKSTAKVTLNGEKLQVFTLRSEIRQ